MELATAADREWLRQNHNSIAAAHEMWFNRSVNAYQLYEALKREDPYRYLLLIKLLPMPDDPQ